MPLANPVVVYSASTNQEAILLKHLLIEAGIESDITQDLSLAGLWMGGTANNIHTPKVWVDRPQAEAATAILADYEKKRFERSELGKDIPADAAPVEGHCEECGATSLFPAIQKGSVQKCPKCEASMDVGPVEEGDWWMANGENEDSESSSE
ncbi:DUF2007 domain-containing protein [Zavarzinella formosa]|uniref:DUF2007 domain-containing protein n=1 Tax=Zavarzinella formosa TaxID=360055 RepID=UPI00030EA677|nr:DUF2007 domain-containing protein [Zavarzinella formosa]